MARGSAYKPETPRPGTEKATNDLNIQNIFAILNRMQEQVNSLEEYVNSLAITISTGDAESRVHGLMMMDDD